MSYYDDQGLVLPHIGKELPKCMPFPLLRASVEEAENNIQAPQPLILFAALTSLAVSLQGLFDVRKPIGQVVPVSLMLLPVANSGERKSTAENIFLDPIRNFQRKRSLIYQIEFSEWQAKSKIWLSESKAILKRIGKLPADHEDFDAEKRCFIDHGNNRPVKPRQFKMLYEDCTSEALFSGIHQDFPAVGLISSEGGGIINGRALNDLSKQNAVWSGDSIIVDRKTAPSYEIYGARCSVSIMLQENIFNDYNKRRGEKARGSGLFARFLVCNPRSTQGTRFIKNGTISWWHRDRFIVRLNEILEQNLILLSEPSRKRQVVGFSPEASELWLDVFNAIESEIKEGKRFAGLGDHASKLADNITRVAALLHLFERFPGDISLNTLRFSVDFCLWCSDEFRYLFVPPAQEEVDALELNKWLRGYRDGGEFSLPKNFIRQHCPNKLREKNRLNRALEVLYSQREIAYYTLFNKQYIDLCQR